MDWHVLIAIAIVVVIAKVFASRSHDVEADAPRLRTTGKYFREVVGESNYQEALKAATRGADASGDGIECEAMLVPEDGNRYDKNAICIEIDGRTVGYLPKEEARLYRGRLKRAGLPIRTYMCPAKIVGGGKKLYGVWLDLPDRLN